jgi:hypothetical protein
MLPTENVTLKNFPRNQDRAYFPLYTTLPITENNEASNNLIQNSVEPQCLQSLSNHNDSFCSILDSPNNTIQTDIHNLDLSYNDIYVINQNFYYHQNFKEQIEDEFKRTNLNIQNHLIDHYYLNNKVPKSSLQ